MANETEKEVIRLQPNEFLTQVRLRRLEPHIVFIQDVIRALSQRHDWYPENQYVETMHGRVVVIIPLPDHIPIPDFTQINAFTCVGTL